MADLVDRTLELIPKYESPEGNVRNKQYDPTHTAQGYWQITDTNWNAYGPKAGVDIKKYPHAMDASREDQKKVARHLLMNTDQGIKNWMAASNPKFLDEWDTLSGVDTKSSEGVKGDTGTKSGQMIVKKPPQGWFQHFAEEKDPESTFSPSQGFGLVPGARKLTRAATGYGLPPGATWKTRASEGLEGLGDVSLPIGVGAATLATGGAAGGALMAGEGLGSAALAGGGALLPYAAGAGGSLIGSQVMGAAAPEISSDPETQRLLTDVGGIAGGFLGGIGGPKIFKSPVGRAAVGAFIGHHTGIPYGGELGAILGAGGDYFPGKLGKAIRIMGKSGEEGAGPKPTTLPKTSEMDDAIHYGTVSDEAYKAHAMKLGATEAEAQVKLDTAKARSIQKTAEEAVRTKKEAQARQERLAKEAQAQKEKATKEAQRQAEKAAQQQQGPMMQATPEMIRSSTNPTGPVSVTLPEGITVKAPARPGPIPQGTGMPQAPVASPPPGSMGTLNPPVGQPGPPLAGPAATGTPVSPSLGAMPPPEPIPGSAGPQGLVNAPPGPQLQGPAAPGTPIGRQLTPDLPVAPPASNVPPAPGLGPVAAPGVRPSGPPAPVPTRTPLGGMPPSNFEAMGIKIADVAERINKTPPKTSNKTTLKRWARELGVPEESLTKEQMIEGRRVYDQRIRTREQRNP